MSSRLLTWTIKGHKIGTRIEAEPSKPLGFSTWETTGSVKGIEMERLTPEEVAATNKSEG